MAENNPFDSFDKEWYYAPEDEQSVSKAGKVPYAGKVWVKKKVWKEGLAKYKVPEAVVPQAMPAISATELQQMAQEFSQKLGHLSGSSDFTGGWVPAANQPPMQQPQYATMQAAGGGSANFGLPTVPPLQGPEKFGLSPDASPGEGHFGLNCVVCGYDWSSHSGWDCLPFKVPEFKEEPEDLMEGAGEPGEEMVSKYGNKMPGPRIQAPKTYGEYIVCQTCGTPHLAAKITKSSDGVDVCARCVQIFGKCTYCGFAPEKLTVKQYIHTFCPDCGVKTPKRLYIRQKQEVEPKKDIIGERRDKIWRKTSPSEPIRKAS